MLNDSQYGQPISAELVEEQLRRLQSCSLFVHSRRYPAFLGFVVQKALQGKQDELKERTIGVEAFGRSPDYDLNTDPIVRFIAGEVRKRLAQYYYEAEHQAELRIELRSGSYIPEFKYVSSAGDTPENGTALASVAPAASDESNLPSANLPTRPEGYRKLRKILPWIAAAVLFALALSAGMHFWTRSNSAFEEFWKPVLTNTNPVLICVGSPTLLVVNDRSNTMSAESVGLHALSSNPVAMADAVAVERIQLVLSSRSRQNSLQSHTEVSFSDLQKGPVILVSAFDNPWTMRLTDTLRFHFVRTAADIFKIEDRFDPANHRWTINTLTPFTRTGHDYALVARFRDSTTDQTVVVAAGIGENGTLAAGELISDPRFLEESAEKGALPRRYGNMEAVIETETINGKPGPPQILAVHTW